MGDARGDEVGVHPPASGMDCNWWARPAPALGRPTLSAALVPVLWVAAIVGHATSNELVLELGRPAAEIVFAVGLGIQVHETVIFEGMPLGACRWVFSLAAHISVVPLYAGVAVTELGIGVAALVFGAGLLLIAAFGGPNGWPYGLSPVVCATLVVCALTVRLF